MIDPAQRYSHYRLSFLAKRRRVQHRVVAARLQVMHGRRDTPSGGAPLLLERGGQSAIRSMMLSIFTCPGSRATEANVLQQKYDCSITNLVSSAKGSAAALVNILARDFGCFLDEHGFNGRRKPVRFLKRAQILVADLWACFDGQSWGEFRDIDKITMFADYRVPQILSTLGCISYSPPLQALVNRGEIIPSGSNFEMQLRGESCRSRVKIPLTESSMLHLVRGASQEGDQSTTPGG
jgi:hypothetical protein